MNERVQVTAQGFTTQYAFGLNGQRVSSWDGIACAPTLLSANTYWNGTPVSVFDGYQSSYQHQDLLGTKRLLTGSDGSVIGASTSLPFGDGLSLSGTDTDPYHFAGLDHDSGSGTEHASFRQYSSTFGRWMSPDPFSGSYDFTNPQSLNRYTYVLNNPLTLADPSGLDYCALSDGTVAYGVNTTDDCTAYGKRYGVTTIWVPDSPIDPYGNTVSAEPTFTGEADNGMSVFTMSTNTHGLPPQMVGTDEFGILGLGMVLGPVGPGPFVSDTSQIGGGGSAPNNPILTSQQIQCIGKVAAKDGASLVGDGLGFIPGVTAVKTGIKIGGSLLSSANSTVNGSSTNGRAIGGVGGIIGAQLALLSYEGYGLASAVPIVGTIFNIGLTGYDVYSTVQDIKSCMAGTL